MAAAQSFDITTGCDLQEVDNAVNQAVKEIRQRYDFKGVKAEIKFRRKLADDLVVKVYQTTRKLPNGERYGLQSQIRRAAVSVPTNIVEGCARQSTKDYLRFLTMAMASASEVRYLLNLAARLGFLSSTECEGLESRYDELIRSLQRLISALHDR